MTESYRRLFLRWEVVRGWIPALAFVGVAVAVELFYFGYMTARGLADKQVAIPVGPWTLPLSIALFVSLGNAILLLTLWMSVFENIAYVRAGPDKQIRRILYPLRMLRVAALVLFPFTVVLFLPYIIVSLGFVRFADFATTTIPQLRQSVIDFYNWTFGISRIEASTRFILSQVSAALVTVVIGALQVWRARGTRNLMLLLRRRK